MAIEVIATTKGLRLLFHAASDVEAELRRDGISDERLIEIGRY